MCAASQRTHLTQAVHATILRGTIAAGATASPPLPGCQPAGREGYPAQSNQTSVVLASTRKNNWRSRGEAAQPAAGDKPELWDQPRRADPSHPERRERARTTGGDTDAEPVCDKARSAMVMLSAINHLAHPRSGDRPAEPRVLGRSVRRISDRAGPGSTACPTVAQEAA